MKRLFLILLGFFPLVLGFEMNSWIMQNENSILPFRLIGIIFPAIWILIGLTTSKFKNTILKSAMILHFPAF